ncbi:MAG: hypothetical protein IPP90_02345 [Gemmatimonadaceae bacterium]|nr:hypothetical protein [Gemmatimonadaceae bacterium]
MDTILLRASCRVGLFLALSAGSAGVILAQSGVDLAPARVIVPVSAMVGDSIVVSVVTKNSGTIALSTAWSIRVVLSTDSLITAADPVLREIPVSRIVRVSARDSAVITVRIPVATAPGTYFIGAVADPTNVVAELNERNNLRWAENTTLVASRFDLAVTAIDKPAAVQIGTAMALGIRITNLGTAQTPPGWVGRVYLSTDRAFSSDDHYLGDFVFQQALGASATSTVSLSYQAAKLGDFYLVAIVDGANEVGESAEGNNVAASTSLIHFWEAYIDLTAAFASVPSTVFSAPASGETFPIVLELRNLGTLKASPANWTTQVFLSDNSTIDGFLETTKDVLLTSHTEASEIPAGGSVTRTLNVTLPPGLTPSGTLQPSGTRTFWYLGLKVDATSLVSEARDPVTGNNNTLAWGLQVTAAPDLEVISATVAPRSGSSAPIIATIRNNGPGAAPSGWSSVTTISGPNASRVPGAIVRTIGPSPTRFDQRLPGGTTTTLAAASLPSDAAPGAYTLVIALNSTPQMFSEEFPTATLRLENNTRQLTVQLSTQWDIMVDSLAATSDGHWFAYLKNVGGGTVPGNWQVNLFASGTPADASTWRTVGSATMVDPLVAGIECALLLDSRINMTTVRNDDFLIAVIDVTDVIPETNEQNNRGVSTKPLKP